MIKQKLNSKWIWALVWVSFFPNIVSAQLKGGITVEVVKPSACASCTGQIKVSIPPGLAGPYTIEVFSGYVGNGDPVLVQPDLGKADVADSWISPAELCSGRIGVKITTQLRGFESQSCGQNTWSGIIPGLGEGSFAVNLASNVNQALQLEVIPSTAYTFQWSTGATTNPYVQAPCGSHTVTVTDEAGCTKVAGPFATRSECYDANCVYTGKAFNLSLESSIKEYLFSREESSGQTSYSLSLFAPGLGLKLSSLIDGQKTSVGYTFEWKSEAGVVLSTTSELNTNLLDQQKIPSLTLLVKNQCEERKVNISVRHCGSISSYEIQNIIVKNVEQSCFSYQDGDLKTGMVRLNLPAFINSSATSTISGLKIQKNGSNIEISQLMSGETPISLDLNGCKYDFTVNPGQKDAEYNLKELDKDNNCVFFRRCDAFGKWSDSPIEKYPSVLSIVGSTDKKACEKKFSCFIGDRLVAGPIPRGTVPSVSTFGDIFDSVIKSVLENPDQYQLPLDKRKRLRELCNHYERCTKVSFCPESFDVIDDSKVKGGLLGFGAALRRDEIITLPDGQKCRVIECGKKKAPEQHTTCDPALSSVVLIENPLAANEDNEYCGTPKQCKPSDYESKTITELLNIESTTGFGENYLPGTDLHNLLKEVKMRNKQNRVACFEKIKYCPYDFVVVSYLYHLNLIKNFDCPQPCSGGYLTTNLGEIKTNPPTINLPGSDLQLIINKLKSPEFNLHPVQRFQCKPITYCKSDFRVKNYDRIINDEINAANLCDYVSPFDCQRWVNTTLDQVVETWRNPLNQSPSKLNELFGVTNFEDTDIRYVISLLQARQVSASEVICIDISYCQPKGEVDADDIQRIENVIAAGNKFNCPNLLPEEISLTKSNTELDASNLQVVKYFTDSLQRERFLRFSPLLSDGSLIPKGIMSTDQGNYYYNYSHDLAFIDHIQTSSELFKSTNWDDSNQFTLHATASNREYFLVYQDQEKEWAIPFESDSLLHFSNFSVRDSSLYVSGYYTGALRYRAELVSDVTSHNQITGFVLRINQLGDLRAVALFTGIDTLQEGFRMNVGKQGNILVSGKLGGDSLFINGSTLNGISSNDGFIGTLSETTLQFRLLKSISIANDATIVRSAIEPNNQAYAFAVNKVGQIIDQVDVIQATNGNNLGVFAIDTTGTLRWVNYFEGNLDSRQMDIVYGDRNRLNVGFTYEDDVLTSTTQFFSRGKQDIGLIQFDSLGVKRWVRSYGSPETETVMQLLYDEGILFFGGNIAGEQVHRSIGGYDFYNPTPFHERAYVSYYADSIAVDSTLANTPELAALSTPVLQKSSTPDRTFKVFPNPFKDEILTEFEAQNSENMSIEVLNELGRVVKIQRFGAIPGFNRQQISTQQFPAGIYFIYLRNQAGQVLKVQKLVKM